MLSLQFRERVFDSYIDRKARGEQTNEMETHNDY